MTSDVCTCPQVGTSDTSWIEQWQDLLPSNEQKNSCTFTCHPPPKRYERHRLFRASPSSSDFKQNRSAIVTLKNKIPSLCRDKQFMKNFSSGQEGELIDSNLWGNWYIIPNLQGNRIYKEIGFPQNRTFQIYKETGFQKVTFAYKFQIYKEIGNLQNRPFAYNFSSPSSHHFAIQVVISDNHKMGDFKVCPHISAVIPLSGSSWQGSSYCVRPDCHVPKLARQWRYRFAM